MSARDQTAGATRITPSMAGGSGDASAVSSTAPPMLSPRAKTGTPG